MKCSKKGTAFDFLRGIIIIFILTVIVILALNINNSISSEPDIVNVTNNSASIYATFNQGMNALDFFVPALFIGIMIGSMALAFAVNAHPSVFLFNVLLLILLLGLTATLANSRENLMDDFPTEKASLTVTNAFWDKSPTIALVHTVLVTVIMIAGKVKGGEGE